MNEGPPDNAYESFIKVKEFTNDELNQLKIEYIQYQAALEKITFTRFDVPRLFGGSIEDLIPVISDGNNSLHYEDAIAKYDEALGQFKENNADGFILWLEDKVTSKGDLYILLQGSDRRSAFNEQLVADRCAIDEDLARELSGARHIIKDPKRYLVDALLKDINSFMSKSIQLG